MSETTITSRLLGGEVLFVPLTEAGGPEIAGWYSLIKERGRCFHRRRTSRQGVDGFEVWVDDVPSGYKARTGRPIRSGWASVDR